MADPVSGGLVVSAVDAVELELHAVVALYRSVGWTAYTEEPERLAAALAGSAHVVVARRGAEVWWSVWRAHQRTGVGRALVAAVMEPFAGVRQRVLLTDDEPGQRAFHESLGYREAGEHPAGPLRAFVRIIATDSGRVSGYRPPATRRTAPVTYPASGPRSQAMAEATSWG